MDTFLDLKASTKFGPSTRIFSDVVGMAPFHEAIHLPAFVNMSAKPFARASFTPVAVKFGAGHNGKAQGYHEKQENTHGGGELTKAGARARNGSTRR